MKYCPRCGTALQDDNQFCYRCGLKQQDWRQVSGGEASPSQQQDTSAGQAEANQGTGASSQSGEKTEAHWTTNGQWPKPPSSGPWYQQSGGNSSGPHPSGQWTGGAQNQGQWPSGSQNQGQWPGGSQNQGQWWSGGSQNQGQRSGASQNQGGWVPGSAGQGGYWTEGGFVPNQGNESGNGNSGPAYTQQTPPQPSSQPQYQSHTPNPQNSAVAAMKILALIGITFSIFIPYLAIAAAIAVIAIYYINECGEEAGWTMPAAVLTIVAALASMAFQWF